ncbi:hypothetical protein [Arthrobacter sp. fls2-241-R2A-200]|uniref:hypothetical protein n=1 Tax=Arthrobacter sp. fls2-241-R2A-200 TaxID=3040281 RepID=UPI0025501C02|nr:hypothetical protein [Arthrobacter sp. fls2-241-R2A-200]
MTEQNLPDDELDVAQEDPLTSDEAVSGEEEDFLSDGKTREQAAQPLTRLGDERAKPDTPTLEEAAADIDFGEAPTGREADASDEEEEFGGSPLSEFEPDDLEH